MQAVRTYAQQVFERFVEEWREIAEQQVAADLRKILVKHLFWRNHTHKLDSFEPSRRKEDISISKTFYHLVLIVGLMLRVLRSNSSSSEYSRRAQPHAQGPRLFAFPTDLGCDMVAMMAPRSGQLFVVVVVPHVPL